MIKHDEFKNTPIVTSGGVVHFDKNGIGTSDNKRAEEILLNIAGFKEVKEEPEKKKETPKDVKEGVDEAKEAPKRNTTRRKTTKKVEEAASE